MNVASVSVVLRRTVTDGATQPSASLAAQRFPLPQLQAPAEKGLPAPLAVPVWSPLLPFADRPLPLLPVPPAHLQGPAGYPSGQPCCGGLCWPLVTCMDFVCLFFL